MSRLKRSKTTGAPGLGEAVEAACVFERRLGGREGEGGGERFAVEGAPQPEPVEAERQGGEPAVERAEGGRDAAEQLRGAERAYACAGVVELVFCVGADGEVEAGAEEAAFAAGEPVGELVGVFGGGGDAEVGEAAAFGLDPPRRLEAGALLLEALRGELGRERLDVE